MERSHERGQSPPGRRGGGEPRRARDDWQREEDLRERAMRGGSRDFDDRDRYGERPIERGPVPDHRHDEPREWLERDERRLYDERHSYGEPRERGRPRDFVERGYGEERPPLREPDDEDLDPERRREFTGMGEGGYGGAGWGYVEDRGRPDFSTRAGEYDEELRERDPGAGWHGFRARPPWRAEFDAVRGAESPDRSGEYYEEESRYPRAEPSPRDEHRRPRRRRP